MHDLFADLDREWQRLVHSRRARVRTRSWTGLADVDLATLVATVQRRGDPARSDRILATLARHAATDDLAARTVLQCLLPGLKVLAAANRNLEEPGELDAIVVAAAWERIRTYPAARRPRHVASNILLDCRQAIARTRRLRRPLSAVNEPTDVAPVPTSDARDELNAIVVGTHRLGRLSAGDARLIFQTRVLGFDVAEVARQVGMTPTALRQRRSRAEARLGASVG